MSKEIYLLNPNKNKSMAHHWTGVDTLCRMYGSNGMRKDRQEIFESTLGKPICLMCSNVKRRFNLVDQLLKGTNNEL
jgi:hypothetical protein